MINQHRLFSNLRTRALILSAIRDFFSIQGFLEVDTPLRNPCVIPEAHIDSIKSEEWVLHSSPELCMKRLLCHGSGNIFQICKVFRNHERGIKHLPELTLLEWYATPATYLDLMNQTEQLIKHIALKLNTGDGISYQKNRINLTGDWQRITVADAFEKYGRMALLQSLDQDMFDPVISFDIEPNLGNPTPCFLYDYPSSQASLAKLKAADPDTAQRFECYMAGIELANGFTELTDPVEQRARFKKENQLRQKLGKPVMTIPEKFLEDLSHMPDAAGVALGIDRLVMLFCDAAAIDEVVAFTPEML